MTASNGRSVLGDVEGTIEQVNEHGLKIAGRWLNVSRFGTPVQLPTVGTFARVTFDARDYIHQVDVLATPTESHTLAAAVRPASDRDQQIRRQVAMKTAAQLVGSFAQTREEVKVEHVFPLADRILKWLEEDPS